MKKIWLPVLSVFAAVVILAAAVLAVFRLQSRPADGEPENLPAVGDTIAGFVLEDIQPFEPLNAQILTFRHQVSGAQLCYIRNQDTNRTFSIAYRTPYRDESDINHVFEHSIIASSEKYPSTDLFFDMISKTYSTYLNAYTYPCMTYYPLSSQSEAQLLKMTDVLLSCMVAPSVLKEENFFKREALRYMLYDLDGPITMGGTVFTEDSADLASTESEASNNVLDALYPGEYASNMVGRAFANYQDLTYDKVAELYNLAYHFDNALMVLYGDLDYVNFLTFLDSAYLSRYPSQHTDLSAYDDPAAAPGYIEQVVDAPAYEGDAGREASVISYAFDLDGQSWEKLDQYSVLCDFLNQSTSVLNQALYDAGLMSQVSAYVSTDSAKPHLVFAVGNANPEDSAAFKAAVDDTLASIQAYGVDSYDLESYIKISELNDYAALQSSTAVVDGVIPSLLMKWTHTGKTDYLPESQRVFEEIAADADQTIFRSLAGELLRCEHSAMVTTVPKPGLAEERLAQQEAYLAEMKASMTPEELEQMVADTLAFDAWNDTKVSSSDFIIPVSDLPDPAPLPAFRKEEKDGAVYYTAAAENGNVAFNMVRFDTSAVPQEDLYYLSLYSLLVGGVSTDAYTLGDVLDLTNLYLHGLWANAYYPDQKAGENNRPFLSFEWTSLAGDYQESLGLLMEILEHSRFDNREEMLEAVDAALLSLDGGRKDPYDLATEISFTAYSESARYQEYLKDQGCFAFLTQLRQELEQDPAAMAKLTEKLEQIREKILHRDHMMVISIASEEHLEELSGLSQAILGELPSAPAPKPSYSLPGYPDRVGIIAESSLQYSAGTISLQDAEGLSGAFFPYIIALNDQYMVPELRFKGLAYSAEASFGSSLNYLSFMSYSDPNVAKTIQVYEAAAEALASLTLTQEDLDGYILHAYSLVTAPASQTSMARNAIEMEINGTSVSQLEARKQEILSATLEDQAAAADLLARLLDRMQVTMVGNDKRLTAQSDCFDVLYDYRQPLDTGLAAA